MCTIQSRLDGSAVRVRASRHHVAVAPVILRGAAAEAFPAWRRTYPQTRHSRLQRAVVAVAVGGGTNGLIAIVVSADPSAPSEE